MKSFDAFISLFTCVTVFASLLSQNFPIENPSLHRPRDPLRPAFLASRSYLWERTCRPLCPSILSLNLESFSAAFQLMTLLEIKIVKRKLFLWFFRSFDYLCGKLPRVGIFRPLRSEFSAFIRLEQQSLSGTVLLHRQSIGPCAPGSMTQRAGMHQNNHQPWPVFWVRSDTARLVGRSFLWRDESDHWCREDAYSSPVRVRPRDDRLFAQTFVRQPLFLEGAWTSIVSKWGLGNNYYHWMMDCLTRLRVREALPEPTRILIPRKSLGFVGETLDMLGLASLAESPVASALQPERYYFCSPTAMTGAWNPYGFNWLREKFAPFCQTAVDGKAVFLTRRNAARIPSCLPEIEDIFTRYGFMVVDCAALSVREQMRIASGAPAIAGLHGAAMTNLLWAQPGTPVIEIFSPHWLNGVYEQIALHFNLNYQSYIMNHVNDMTHLNNWCQSTKLRSF